MRSIFSWSKENLFHLSIGVLLTNDRGEICVHHFREGGETPRHLAGMGSATEYYLLMRESLENNETIERAIERGLMEEFGATGEIVRYLGSIQAHFPIDTFEVEKTTLYFHARCTSFDLSKRLADDGESGSTIEWIVPENLIELMERSGSLMERTDRDEAKIVKAYITSNK